MQSINERIFAIIDSSADLKDSDLAEYIGISKAAVSKWRSGVNTPNYKYLSKIAEFLNVSQHFLEEGKNPNELEDVYLSLAKEAKANAIDPEDIKMAIKMIRDIREAEKKK